MELFDNIFGKKDTRIKDISRSGLLCSRCERRIEEGLMPCEMISEWYGKWVVQGWFQGEDLLLKCRQCGRIYCSDCFSRFYQMIDDPLLSKKCICGKRDFILIAGRQYGSKI